MFNTISATGNSATGGVAMLIVFIALSVLLVFTAVGIIAKYHKVDKERTLMVGKLKNLYVLLIILAAGLVVRLLFVFFINGNGFEYNLAYNVAYAFKTNGNFSDFSVTYLGVGPLLGYIFMIFGNMGIGLNLSKDAVWMQFFIKLPYVLADIACLVLLYFVSLKYTNGYVALAISSLYYLNPVFFMLSSVWGSPMSLLALAVLLTAYFLLEKNIFGMTVSTVAGLLVNPSFMFVGTIVLAYLVYQFVLSIIKIVSLKPTISEISRDGTLSNVFYIPVCLAIGLMATYLLALPAFYADGVTGFGAVYGKLFIDPLQFNASEYAVKYFTFNGLSIFTLFVQNGVMIGNKFPSLIYFAVLLVISLVVMLFTFISKKNRANLIVIVSYALALFGIFGAGTDAWALAPALLTLILAFVVVRDKRLLRIFGILSLLVVINATMALIGGDQIGQVLVVSDFCFLTDDLLNVFSILFSVLAVLMFIYYTVVALDISLTKHRYSFTTDENSPIGKCLINWYRNS